MQKQNKPGLLFRLCLDMIGFNFKKKNHQQVTEQQKRKKNMGLNIKLE